MLLRRNDKAHLYTMFTMFKCANPDCVSGSSVEAHHIHPLSKGGADKYWNLISLCHECHHKSGNHSGRNDIELFTWKSYQELDLWGFTLDEESDDFYEKLKILVLVKNYIQDHK
jgi:5-methylcytosine-specific restriction endonuclease McrA